VHAGAAELAFALAERVLSACASHERLVAVEALRVALAHDLGAGARLARVHPVDLAACEAEAARAGSLVRVVTDGSLRPGDVVLEGATGLIDARLRARLEALRASLEPAV
jgi:flagellar biosynthesis/type III secretory pathway protein FliH